MVDTKKEQEREELHRAIWAIADDLRGAVDGWDFKSYVLGTMFYRYISENIASYINQGEIDAGNPDFSYEDMPCGGRIPNRSIWILLGCADARFGIGRTGDCCLQRNDVS